MSKHKPTPPKHRSRPIASTTAITAIVLFRLAHGKGTTNDDLVRFGVFVKDKNNLKDGLKVLGVQAIVEALEQLML